MARNEEKQLGRLNRLVLAKQKADQLEQNPKRPHVDTINSSEDIKKWLPSIKSDIEHYLTQTKVACYPERKIQEFDRKINYLRWEYETCVKKLRKIDPECSIIPWTERSYGKRKEQIVETLTNIKVLKSGECKKSKNQNEMNFDRLKLPILEGDTEKIYQKEKDEMTTSVIGASVLLKNDNLEDRTVSEPETEDKERNNICINNESSEIANLKDKNLKHMQIIQDSVRSIDSAPVYVDTGEGSYNNKPLQFSVKLHVSNIHAGVSVDSVGTTDVDNGTVTDSSTKNNMCNEPKTLIKDSNNCTSIGIVNYSSSDDSS